LNIQISMMFHQKFYNFKMTIEWSTNQSGEAILKINIIFKKKIKFTSKNNNNNNCNKKY
jgi:hypothetical protein